MSLTFLEEGFWTEKDAEGPAVDVEAVSSADTRSAILSCSSSLRSNTEGAPFVAFTSEWDDDEAIE